MVRGLSMALLVATACGRIGYDAVGGGDASILDADAEPTCQFRALSLGREHSCAVNALGDVYCWGADTLGVVTATTGGVAQPTPVRVALPEAVDDLALGSESSCARTSAGAVYCWGALDRDNPLGAVTAIDLGGPARQIGGGIGFTCARIGPDDHVACWGDNKKGQLGVPPSPPSPTALTVAGTVGAIDLAVGQRAACARFADGRVRCWGHNDAGALGMGFSEFATPPTDVPALAGYDVLSLGGRHSCGLDGDALRCWGRNARGELGDATGNRSTPGPIVRSGVTAVTTTARSTCVLESGGTVACTGQNRAGELGQGDLAERAALSVVPGLSEVRRLVGGAHHACAEVSGTIQCWGENDRGQLGRGTRSITTRPIAFTSSLGMMTEVAATARAMCARTADGALWCWGDGELGQLGSGTIGGTATPVQVLASVQGVAAGGGHVCAWDSSGLWSWGLGYLGDGTGYSTAPSPVRVLSDPQVTSAAVGFEFGCVIVAGEVRCWGANDVGQLGDGGGAGDEALSPIPASVPTAVEIAAGARHACARTAAGAVWCWGANASGAVGIDSSGQPVPTPVQIALPGGVTALGIAAGRLHSCALGANQQVYCWGESESGQVGNQPADQMTPVLVPLPSSAIGVFTRFDSSCAALLDGRLVCWGAGAFGSLGNGQGFGGAEPTPFGTVTGVSALAGDADFQCAVDGSGALWCAGLGSHGTLGHGLTTATPLMADVPCQ